MTVSIHGARMRPYGAGHVVVLALVLLLGLTGLLAVPATAAPADQQLASDNPDNNTPRVLDGKVQSIVKTGNTMVVAGSFTQVREAEAAAPVLSRTGLFAFNATTGVIDPNFNPVLVHSKRTPEVKSLALSADGQAVYVGGEYRTINDSGPARLQEISLATGQRVGSFQNKAPNKSVFDLKLVGGRLYVAGMFTKIGTDARGGMATLDPGTGSVTNAMSLPFAGINLGGKTTVRKIDLTPGGDRLIAIGNFKTVAGQSRNQVAMLDTSGPAVTVAAWSTQKFPTGCSSKFDTYLRDVDFAPDGSFFVIVTTGGFGSGSGVTCDAATRWETYKGADQNWTWIDYTGGDTFWAVEVTGPVVYVGGHFRWFNNPVPVRGDLPGPGAEPREGIAALDTRNGLPFSWNPGRKRGIGVFDFLVTQDFLWAGSDTSTWSGERRDRLAAFPFSSGKPLPADKLGTLPGDVVQLDSAATGSDVQARYLTGSAAPATTNPSGSENWSNVRGAVMIDNKVYTGWSDGTFRVRSFDGVSFGSPTNLELRGGGFAQDASQVTSMFFDKRDGRLYYTLPNSGPNRTDGGLYYRYFTPESGVVGATRFNDLRAASQAAIDGGNIQGSFLVGDQLHYVDKNGTLKKITFSPGAFSGSPSTVNNAINWGAKGLFASTASSASGPNVNPTAGFTVDCFGLSCTFDASSSSDSDGSISNYAWTYGDGSTGSGKIAHHTFSSASTFSVALTVTDNRGGIGSKSQPVTVSPVPSSITFRTADSYASKARSNHSWSVPAGVQSGDLMLLAVTGSTDAVPSTPAGWNVAAEVLDSDTRTVLYTRTAGAATAGSPINVTWTQNGSKKATVTVMSLAAYSGVSSVKSVIGEPETSTQSTTEHTTPATTVPKTGDWVVSYWSDKNASTTGWSAPDGQQVRAQPVPGVNAGSVRVTGLLTDDGGPAAGGARAGATATASGSAKKATAFSIVLSSF